MISSNDREATHLTLHFKAEIRLTEAAVETEEILGTQTVIPIEAPLAIHTREKDRRQAIIVTLTLTRQKLYMKDKILKEASRSPT